MANALNRRTFCPTPLSSGRVRERPRAPASQLRRGAERPPERRARVRRQPAVHGGRPRVVRRPAGDPPASGVLPCAGVRPRDLARCTGDDGVDSRVGVPAGDSGGRCVTGRSTIEYSVEYVRSSGSQGRTAIVGTQQKCSFEATHVWSQGHTSSISVVSKLHLFKYGAKSVVSGQHMCGLEATLTLTYATDKNLGLITALAKGTGQKLTTA